MLGRPEAVSANMETKPMVAESCFSSRASHSDCGDVTSTSALSARRYTQSGQLKPTIHHLRLREVIGSSCSVTDGGDQLRASDAKHIAFLSVLAYLSPAGFVSLDTGFEGPLLPFEGGGARLLPLVSASVLQHLAIDGLLAPGLDDSHPVLDAVVLGFGWSRVRRCGRGATGTGSHSPSFAGGWATIERALAHSLEVGVHGGGGGGGAGDVSGFAADQTKTTLLEVSSEPSARLSGRLAERQVPAHSQAARRFGGDWCRGTPPPRAGRGWGASSLTQARMPCC